MSPLSMRTPTGRRNLSREDLYSSQRILEGRTTTNSFSSKQMSPLLENADQSNGSDGDHRWKNVERPAAFSFIETTDSTMKLTQKTLFQCFDKSRRKSPSISDHDEISLLDVIECEPEIKSPIHKREVPVRHPDFLLPIHVRQGVDASPDEIVPLLNQWQLIPIEDDPLPSDHLGHFPRLSSASHHNESTPPLVIAVQFTKITSPERQMELFQQYTNDDLSSYGQFTTDWPSMFQSFQDSRQTATEQGTSTPLL